MSPVLKDTIIIAWLMVAMVLTFVLLEKFTKWWLNKMAGQGTSQDIHLTASETTEQLPAYPTGTTCPTDHHDEEVSEEASAVLAATDSETTSLAPTTDKTPAEDKQLTEVTDKQFNSPQAEPASTEENKAEQAPPSATVTCIVFERDDQGGFSKKTTLTVPLANTDLTTEVQEQEQPPQPPTPQETPPQAQQEPPQPASILPPENKEGEEKQAAKKVKEVEVGTAYSMVVETMSEYQWLKQAGFSHEEAEQYMNKQLVDTKEHRDAMEQDNKEVMNALAKQLEQKLLEKEQRVTAGEVANSLSSVVAVLSRRLATLEAAAVDQLGSLKDEVLNLRTRVALLEGKMQGKSDQSHQDTLQMARRFNDVNRAMAIQQGANNERLTTLEKGMSVVTELTNKLHKKVEDFGGAVNSLLPGGTRAEHQFTINKEHQTALLNLRTRIDQVAKQAAGRERELISENKLLTSQLDELKQATRSQPVISQGLESHPEVKELWKGRGDLNYTSKSVEAARSVLELRLQLVKQNVPVSQWLTAACSEAEQLLLEHFHRVRNSYRENTDDKPLQGVHCNIGGMPNR